MKNTIITAALASVMVLGMSSCTDELNIHSIDPKTSPTYNVEQLLTKQYATLGTTGQKGPAGSADLSMDEGESGFYRTVFNLEELPTDEVFWAWQTDDGIPALTNMTWNAGTSRTLWAYSRLSYDITLYNQFISEQTGKLSDDQIAEVRFLRALHYYYFLDLFHRAPFKTEFNGDLPTEKVGKDLYDWIDAELTDIEGKLQPIGSYNNATGFGRADCGAAYALHAQLCLNAEVYTDGQVNGYAKAKDYCDKIINSKAYSLSKDSKNGYSGYAQLFMADNDENEQAMKEIIFPIRQDGAKTRQYGGATYLVSAPRANGMPYMGTNNGWSCILARKQLVEKFFSNDADIPMLKKEKEDDEKYKDTIGFSAFKNSYAAQGKSTEDAVIAWDKQKGVSTADVIAKAHDDRAMFYGGIGGDHVRTLAPNKQITSFYDGLSIVKWQGLRSDGKDHHDVYYADTDIPLFRLGVIYLTRAECEYRLGDSNSALKDLKELSERANTAAPTSVDANILINEWAKETYMEGRRRSDLIRFGLFTSGKYLWSFKGGSEFGSGVESYLKFYPLPASDLAGNPNLHQNTGY